MSQITVGPPDLKTADPRAVALAKYLRHHELLKQRPALLNGERKDFFRFKRAARALQDPAYEKARAKNPLLPEVDTPDKLSEAIRLLPLNRLAFNVTKLETDFALQNGLKPVSGVPCCMVSPEQRNGPDEYYMWFYSPAPLKLYLQGIGILGAVVALIFFPLWPFKARKLAWMLSLWALVFVALMIVLAIVRLILFGLTLVLAPPGIWLFPNLFADVGFLDSFRPLYSWRGQRTLPQKVKRKKRARTPVGAAPGAAAGQAAGAAGAAGASGSRDASPQPGQPGQQMSAEQQAAMARIQANPMLQQLMARTLGQANERVEQRLREKVAQEDIKDPELVNKLKIEYMQQELQNVQAELQKAGLVPPGAKLTPQLKK
ncbi:Translocation protein SEC62 [Wickerhamiella sorbophila]|uniref:Translocation protein SEC62 n=1 Tax=Wickerhamiella sorbophila TaxID=45607 RepID=A0A2T0FDU2_9ASCO|nr:Translocation protein SEC62 [Wickerhamiella sorbophila]PRT53174.1 Translocation protein SEC62 [Wickerhamiella sorbophila]